MLTTDSVVAKWKCNTTWSIDYINNKPGKYSAQKLVMNLISYISVKFYQDCLSCYKFFFSKSKGHWDTVYIY